MTIPVFDRLSKILALEEKQAWRNRAVVGGMQAMCVRWTEDARKTDADPQIIAAVVSLMTQYESAEKDARPALASQMHQAIAGDLSGLEALAAADIDALLQAAQPDRRKGKRNTRSPQRPRATTTTKKASEPVRNVPQSGAALQPTPQAQASPPSHDEHPTSPPESLEPQPAPVPPAEPTHKARARVRRQQEEANRSPRDLQASIDILAGVGPAIAEQFSRLGVNQVIDALWHLPTRYDDFSQMRTISELQPGEQVTIIANLWELRERKVSMKRQMVQGIIADGTGTLHATWWNKYITKNLETNKTYRFSGKVGLYMGQKTLDSPVFEDVEEEMVATGRLAPVYRLTEGLSNNKVRNVVQQVVDGYVRFLHDPLPDAVRTEHQLMDLASALHQIHLPDNREQMEEARRRLIFEEFFYLQLGVVQRRDQLQKTTSLPLPSDDEMLARFTATLAFDLTGAQARVLNEIRADLARGIPMTRLVQGDVGSGKTAVAAGAMYMAASNGTQSALLAPTQILAEQHHRGISSLLEQLTRADGTPLNVALLTGRVTGAARQAVLAGLRDGTIDIVVGTTAIIQEGVEFANVGFVVVDEQHRFGVQQRGAIRNRGDAEEGQSYQPHMLVMSATPIPRSLALTIYGELDVSVIDEMPPGRTPIQTKWFRPPQRERLYAFLKREVRDGRQGYIVYPLVEESEKLDVGAATAEYERLRTEIFSNERLALLHGRMSGAEKDEVMSAFATGDYDILISTTVIEVGIDVSNASLIIIEDAERFGLAQLHQLRGRVGRGQHKSYCALVSDGKSADAEERLTALQETNDGFKLAEKDLELRGPGDFLGTRQSGLPDLRVAQLGDLETLTQAREAAQKLIAEDPQLGQHPDLSKQVARFWRGHGDVS